MTASLAYLLGSGNSLIWSWFFWVHVHPVASVMWFVFCFFALVISIEVRQLEQNRAQDELPDKLPSFTYVRTTGPLKHVSKNVGVPDVVEVVVIPPAQLPSPPNSSRSKRNRKSQVAQIAQVGIAQLPSSID